MGASTEAMNEEATLAPFQTALAGGSMRSLTIFEEEGIANEGFQGDRIQVAVRLRPLNSQGVQSNSRNTGACLSTSLRLRTMNNLSEEKAPAWAILNNDTIVQKGQGHKTPNRNLFTMDAIFDETTDTRAIYEQIGRPIVKSVVSGRHGTVFAYGQTGSGKTFTMQGQDRPLCGQTGSGKTFIMQGEDRPFDSDDEVVGTQGFIQMAMEELFESIETCTTREWEVKVQYFEIYNEDVHDLIGMPVSESPRSVSRLRNSSSSRTRSATPQNPRYTTQERTNHVLLPTLKVLEDRSGNVFVNAREKVVTSADECIRVLRRGNHNRSCAATDANQHSSRSHAVFRVSLESRLAQGSSPVGHSTARVSVLNLVDLAGSENGRVTGNNVARKREGGQINKSLLALSRVIQALSLPEEERPGHISFRNSKLTRILQPSLSGNAAMAILCCASTAKSDIEETRSTLKFASSAKKIAVKPVVNEIVDDKEAFVRLQKELAAVKSALQMFKDQQCGMSKTTASISTSGSSCWFQQEGQLSPQHSFRTFPRSSASGLGHSLDSLGEALAKPMSVGGSVSNMVVQGNHDGCSPRSISGILDDYSSHSGRTLPPVSEVEITEPNHYMNADRLEEQRVSYLEERIEATESMMEQIHEELKISRKYLVEAAEQQRALQVHVSELQRETKEASDENSQVLSSWYFLFCIVLYALGMKDFFVSAIVFLWLSMQVSKK